MAICSSVQTIAPTECIGDSLVKINNNFANLNTDTCNLQTQITSLSSNLGITPLFIPVNYTTLSNRNIVAIPGTGNTTKFTGGNPLTNNQDYFWYRQGTISTAPWWSGVQTATLSAAPAGAVGGLVNIYFNVNAFNNNAQYLFVRKDSTENWRSPLDQGGSVSGDITTTQRDNIDYSFAKLNLDPSATDWEAEHTTTIPVYFNTTSKTFQWFILDSRSGARPNIAPEYIVRITVLGYYVSGTI